MTVPYTVGCFIKFEEGGEYVCPHTLKCTRNEPLDALKCVMELVELYALRALIVRREYKIRFIVSIGETVDKWWYYYNATLRVNYKIPKGGDDDERVELNLIPTQIYYDIHAFHNYLRKERYESEQ